MASQRLANAKEENLNQHVRHEQEHGGGGEEASGMRRTHDWDDIRSLTVSCHPKVSFKRARNAVSVTA